MLSNNEKAFFALVRAGLWEKDVRLWPFEGIEYDVIYRLAEEQSVIGLVAAGLEHVVDVKLPKDVVLQFVGQALRLEQRNAAMNIFIGVVIEKMRNAGINTLLVKGQGVAQCYERPLWRSCGDVDFLLDKENYSKAKDFLIPLSSNVESESGKHLGMTIDSWIVELHGNLSCGLSVKMDRVISDVIDDAFFGERVRSWMNGNIPVFLPAPNNDIILIFTHFLKHFYKGGLGIRQICDWCRLLWTYQEEVNVALLEQWLKRMGLMSEWKAFAAFAVDYLGMPDGAMPLFTPNRKWSRKAKRIRGFVMRVGNMGHNRNGYFFRKYPFVIKKGISFSRRFVDVCNHVLIFPIDTMRFFPTMIINGLRSAAKGIG